MQKTHKKLAIIGAGGHGKVVAATALATALWTEIVFLDDEAEGEILGLPVIGCTGLAGMSVLPAEYDLAVAVGGNAVRERLCRRFAALGFSLPVIIHPSAVIAPDVEIGAGSEKPVRIQIYMSAEVGFFQIEEVLLQKINASPAKPYIELLAGVEGEAMKQYL